MVEALKWEPVHVTKDSPGDPKMSKARHGDGWFFLTRTGGIVYVADKPAPVAAPHNPRIPHIQAASGGTNAPSIPHVKIPSEADLLPDVDPRQAHATHVQTQEMVENNLDDSMLPDNQAADGFYDEPKASDPANDARVMAELQARAAGKVPNKTPTKGVLVTRENLDALQLSLATFGGWLMEEYEHPNTKPRKLWKEIMATAGALIPENIDGG